MLENLEQWGAPRLAKPLWPNPKLPPILVDVLRLMKKRTREKKDQARGHGIPGARTSERWIMLDQRFGNSGLSDYHSHTGHSRPLYKVTER